MDEPSEKDRLHITADRMIAQTNANKAEFIGNVHAVQGATQIRADRLHVFYNSGGNKAAGASGSMQDAVERIIAEGSVVIDFQDKTATCEKAVYESIDGLLVLTGEPARIESEGNYIIGNEITLNRTTGEIVVNGKADKQVEAVFKSGESGSGAESSMESGRNIEE